ncbi:G-box-binding factor 4-like isoform X1 [Hibiscus syriacus]|uniref:G-box-binding factor 4-like isoform X1 n=1 Tax=Hibiscus syriacus TaxID=106335 RepID=A0A6A2XB14_HIBSY|nr:early nodulin-like protein 1 [Hibiscus syriacus]KAE8666590.1 G-box-binding factor 4-like isoform X1 [Hibiscus syriacus]
MNIFSMLIFLISLIFTFFLASQAATILVDGVSQWKNPTVHVGDSIIFKHKYGCKLYIFQNNKAFNLCNFTQATILTKPNSTSYTWHPSRPGFFYFAFNNGSLKTCQGSQKLSIKASPALLPGKATKTPSPELSPEASPAPTSGGPVVPSSPAYPWPFRPRQEAVSPAPSARSPVTVPSLVPDKGGGISFINSNPAVPLPTDEVDSATIRPLPTSDHGGQAAKGFLVAPPAAAAPMTVFCVAFLVLL